MEAQASSPCAVVESPLLFKGWKGNQGMGAAKRKPAEIFWILKSREPRVPRRDPIAAPQEAVGGNQCHGCCVSSPVAGVLITGATNPKPRAPFAELLRNRPSLVWPGAELTAAVRLPQGAPLAFVGVITILTTRVLRNGEIPLETVSETIWESPNVLTLPRKRKCDWRRPVQHGDWYQTACLPRRQSNDALPRKTSSDRNC